MSAKTNDPYDGASGQLNIRLQPKEGVDERYLDAQLEGHIGLLNSVRPRHMKISKNGWMIDALKEKLFREKGLVDEANQQYQLNAQRIRSELDEQEHNEEYAQAELEYQRATGTSGKPSPEEVALHFMNKGKQVQKGGQQ